MRWPTKDGDFWNWGRWSLLVHDRGWLLACDQIVKFDCPWPTYRTFR